MGSDQKGKAFGLMGVSGAGKSILQGIPLPVEGCIPLRESIAEAYRDTLRSVDSNFEPKSYDSLVKFILLDVQVEVLTAWLEKQAAEAKHFMPATLLQSQLDLLHINNS